MICSICNKNVAVIFINKIENGTQTTEGICYNCAKERGMNPLEILAKQANLTDENIGDMSKQFEDIFQDIQGNLEGIELPEGEIEGNAIPIGAIFSNIFSGEKHPPLDNNANPSHGNKKVKAVKKSKEEKKRFIDIYGTNLTRES